MEENRKKIAVFYARVSSEKEMQLDALESQLKWYDEKERQLSDEYIFLPDRYIDRGITGTQAKKRPEFMRMIEDAKAHKFDVIFTREISRFARNTEESVKYTKELRKIGIEVIFINDGLRSMNPSDNLKLQIMAALAEEESRRDSERVRAGLHIARTQKEGNIWGTGNVMGYDRESGRNKPYTINMEQAETVIMIKDMYLYKDMSLTEIKFELEKLGRKTATGGDTWYESTIGRIIDNPLYCGKQRLLQSEVDNYLDQKRIKNPKDKHILKDVPVPKLYSYEEYLALQEKKRIAALHIGDRAVGKKTEVNIWTEKLICACGSSYYTQKWRTLKDGTAIHGLYCNNKKYNKSKSKREELGLDTADACDIAAIPEWKLEFMAKKILERVWKNKGRDIEEAFQIIKECYQKGPNQIPENEYEKLNKKISKLKNRIENYKDMRADGDLTREEYRQRVNDANAEIEVLEDQKKKVEQMLGTDFDFDAALARIRQSLEEMIDFSKETLDREVLDRFVEFVYHEKDYEYSWFLKLDVSKSKEQPEIPELFRVKIKKKNYFKPEIIVKDKRREIMDTVLVFEEARAYRKAYGNYLRPNAWDDLHVKVYA